MEKQENLRNFACESLMKVSPETDTNARHSKLVLAGMIIKIFPTDKSVLMKAVMKSNEIRGA